MKSKPLSGVRVLDFTRIYAGPFCTMQLGDLGADVVKVEPPGGDPLRHQGPPFLGNLSMSFLCANRNKRSIELDLRDSKDLATVRHLALNADVIVENFRPGVMDRLGLGFTELSEVNLGLIYASLSGFGADGPHSLRGAFDIIIQAEFGYMSITGQKGGKPIKQGTSIFDLACGLYGFGGIMAALHQRQQTGLGQRVETSLMEAEISCLVDAAMDYFVTGAVRERWGSEHSNIVPYKVFETDDGEIVIGAGYQNLFEAFVTTIQRPDLLSDSRFLDHSLRIRNRNELYPILDSVIKGWKTAELHRVLEEAGVPSAPVNDMAAVFSHPQVRHRNMQVNILNHAGEQVPSIGPAVKYSGFDIMENWTSPPELNADRDEIIADWLQ